MSDKKEKSGCPFGIGAIDESGVVEPSVYKATDLTYNTYLKVPELLKLQVPQSNPAHHDELLFIIIHQAYELWFKLVLHELDRVMEQMSEGEVLKARHHMVRVGEIMRLMVSQIHILETMAPADFLQFRDHLNPASGFQSLQFRALEFVAGLKDERYYGFFKNRPEMLEELKKRAEGPDLRVRFYELLTRLGFKLPPDAAAREGREPADREPMVQALVPVYRNPNDHLPLYLLAESMVDFDQLMGLWREHHVRVVERIIGFKRGTGGSSGVGYLKSTTSKKCFPTLWEVRSQL